MPCCSPGNLLVFCYCLPLLDGQTSSMFNSCTLKFFVSRKGSHQHEPPDRASYSCRLLSSSMRIVSALLRVLLCLAVFQHSLAAENVTDVATPEELRDAIVQGAAHIRLRAHMDLRNLTLSPLCPDGKCNYLVLFQVANATESIQVRGSNSHCNSLEFCVPCVPMRYDILQGYGTHVPKRHC
jgi:hypothetical protein